MPKVERIDKPKLDKPNKPILKPLKTHKNMKDVVPLEEEIKNRIAELQMQMKELKSKLPKEPKPELTKEEKIELVNESIKKAEVKLSNLHLKLKLLQENVM